MGFITDIDHALFKQKPMDEQIANQSVPSEDTTETVEDIAVPKEQASPETVVEQSSEKDPIYNCNNCQGEGLQDEYVRCPVCHGTGKV